MSAGTVEATDHQIPGIGAHIAKSMAADLIENGVYEARRAAKSLRRGIETLEDVRDEGIHYVKRNPLTAVAAAAGLGFIVGIAAGVLAGRCGAGARHREATS